MKVHFVLRKYEVYFVQTPFPEGPRYREFLSISLSTSPNTHTMSSEPKNKISAPYLGETVAKLADPGRHNVSRRTSVLECATLPCSPVNARALLLVIPPLSDTDLPASPHLADVQRSNFNSVLKAMSTESTSRPPPTPASITSIFIADVHGERRPETVHSQVRAAWSLSPHETSLHASHIHSPAPCPHRCLRLRLSCQSRCLTTLWCVEPTTWRASWRRLRCVCLRGCGADRSRCS